jgi:hypothetical protein
VAARAALFLAERLVARGRSSAAADLLAEAASAIDSVALGLAAARLTRNAANEGALRRRAPRMWATQDHAVFGEAQTPVYGTLDRLRAAAAACHLTIEDLLPEPAEPVDPARSAELMGVVREREAARWPTPVEELRAQLERARLAHRDAERRLVEHRSKPPVVEHAYMARLKELEAAIPIALDTLHAAERAVDECLAIQREELADALSELEPEPFEEDDPGVVPVPPGVTGLPGATGFDAVPE